MAIWFQLYLCRRPPARDVASRLEVVLVRLAESSEKIAAESGFHRRTHNNPSIVEAAKHDGRVYNKY